MFSLGMRLDRDPAKDEAAAHAVALGVSTIEQLRNEYLGWRTQCRCAEREKELVELLRVRPRLAVPQNYAMATGWLI